VQYCDYSHAKVNLHLEVLAKRENGYHDILSLMMKTGLCDLLKLDNLKVFDGNPESVCVRILPDGGHNASLLNDIPADKNLITKAAREYFKAAGRSAEITVKLEKNIPAGGGLGGGSADAASMLRLLQRSLSALSDDELAEAASRTGADVPFCLSDGAALCEGTGEVIEKVSHNLQCSVLILNDGTHVDTRWAYGAVDAALQYAPIDAELIHSKKKALADLLLKGDVEKLRDLCRNDFELPVFDAFPSIRELKQALIKEGSDFSIMTGSGSTVIGLFRDRNKAIGTRERFINKGISVWLTDFVCG
jgi:4-diphosphocytidyl-2-C-methyl-D-erythritol kinase